jgi:hypothetical protein
VGAWFANARGERRDGSCWESMPGGHAQETGATGLMNWRLRTVDEKIENFDETNPGATLAFLLRYEATGGAPPVMEFRPGSATADALVLWYRLGSAHHGPSERWCSSVSLRWTTADGMPLIWKSDLIATQPASSEWWAAACVPVPLWPRGSAEIRFEVLADSGSGEISLGRGVLNAANG